MNCYRQYNDITATQAGYVFFYETKHNQTATGRCFISNDNETKEVKPNKTKPYQFIKEKDRKKFDGKYK